MAFTGGTVEVRIMDVVPAQTGQAGKVLSTDGVGLQWVDQSSAGSLLYLAENYV